MAGLPNFSTTDRARLKKLGVVDAQIEQLRYACLTIRLAVSRPAARNAVIAMLDDVSNLADKLLKKTAAVDRRDSPAHALTYLLVEQGYWRALPDDHGGTSFQCVAPRLEALRDAAREGKKKLPRAATRHRSATPQPVREIYKALVYGWSKAHGDDVFHIHYEDGKEIKTYPNGLQRKPFPDTFRASAAEDSVFRAIVGICYEAVGGIRDPVTAIKNYLKIERKIRAESMTALEAGIAAATKPMNRTSRKK